MGPSPGHGDHLGRHPGSQQSLGQAGALPMRYGQVRVTVHQQERRRTGVGVVDRARLPGQIGEVGRRSAEEHRLPRARPTVGIAPHRGRSSGMASRSVTGYQSAAEVTGGAVSVRRACRVARWPPALTPTTAMGTSPRPSSSRYGPHVPPSETVRLDPESVRVVETAFRLGEDALREFRPDAERTLWPEHFDLAITVDRVNFGVSPGDGYLDRPYAYVGPHHPLTGDFWNAPFGAARLVDELGDVAEIGAFFRDGARLAARSQP